jgi:hypothetical protein
MCGKFTAMASWAKVVAFSAIAGLAGCAHPGVTSLSESDQDKIAETVLVYSKSHSSFLGMNKITRGYLVVRGDDPSLALLKNLENDGFGFKPGSEGGGDGYLISIGAFAPASSATATGELSTNSRDMGGAVESYTVSRVSGRWRVDGYQLLEILVVATPATYVRSARPRPVVIEGYVRQVHSDGFMGRGGRFLATPHARRG